MKPINYDTLMSAFKEKSKQHKLKITPQRTAVYYELIKSKDHPSAADIFKKVRKTFPGISFDTVNRTLATFSRIGMVSVVEGYGEPRRFDSDIQSHHHFRCVQCNKIVDFRSKAFDQIKIPETVAKRFTVLNKRVVLEGICDGCSKRR